jgi:hypothetical protein
MKGAIMQQLLRIALIAGAIAAVGGRADAYDLCSQTCTQSSSCALLCIDDDTSQVTHCGDWGVCDSCIEDWQAVSSNPIGYYEVNDSFSNTCDYHEVDEVTYHDNNNCGDPDYNRCIDSYVLTSSPVGSCCASYGCGGEYCS